MPRKPGSLAVAAFTLTSALLLVASSASAQFGGQDLPATAVKGMQANITRHQDMKQMADVADLRDRYGEQELETFVDESMAKLTLYPDGRFAAYAKPGGGFVEFKLGGKKFAVAEQTERDAAWLTTDGQFAVPKRSRSVHLMLQAGGREIPIDCAGMFEPGDEPITFWVGDLRGLNCLGFEGTENPFAPEPVKTAALMPRSADSGPQD
jgi:hypothetical protein